MDLQAALKTSRRFYRDHHLDDWRRALPKAIEDISKAAQTLKLADRFGFSRAFAFPPFTLQMESLTHLVDETARKPAATLADNQPYTEEPILSDAWNQPANGNVLQRQSDVDARIDGAYLLVFAPQPAQNAWGRTGKQIIELFQGKGWSGFTVPEYLVLQRFYCERFGDHRFHEESTEKNHWLWLIDSADEHACSVAMANARGVNIQACPLGNRDSRRGAVPALVLSLS